MGRVSILCMTFTCRLDKSVCHRQGRSAAWGWYCIRFPCILINGANEAVDDELTRAWTVPYHNPNSYFQRCALHVWADETAESLNFYDLCWSWNLKDSQLGSRLVSWQGIAPWLYWRRRIFHVTALVFFSGLFFTFPRFSDIDSFILVRWFCFLFHFYLFSNLYVRWNQKYWNVLAKNLAELYMCDENGYCNNTCIFIEINFTLYYLRLLPLIKYFMNYKTFEIFLLMSNKIAKI